MQSCVTNKLLADASSYGLGEYLLQKVGTTWKPVAYTSQSISTTEDRYAKIEKEAFASPTFFLATLFGRI